jgi:CubicO group peptidase (beta-lactamase class C family)
MDKTHHTKKTILNICLVLAFVLSPFGLSLANASDVQAPQNQTEPPVEIGDLSDIEEVNTFVDQLVAGAVKSNKIPGAAVVVVQGEDVLFSKGFGFTDEDKKNPVDPEKTVFQAGSLSTLVEMAALLQLVDQGRISLDTDVNQYLDGYQIKEAFGQPVTVRHLINRTGGFDTLTWIGEPTKSVDQLIPFMEYAKKSQPARVFPPGTQVNLSPFSYDYIVAGAIIESVTGMTYEEYLEKDVLPQIGAANTSGRQPLEGDLAAALSTEFDLKGPYSVPMKSSYYNARPVNGLSTSAHDLALFVRMLLNNGKLGDKVILQQSSVEALMNNPFSHNEHLSPQVGPFIGFNYNGIRGLYMAHLVPDGFTGAIYLFPEKQAGIVLLTNSYPSKLLLTLPTKFAEHYIPASAEVVNTKETTATVALSSEDLERYEGFYHRIGLPEKTLWKTFLIQGTWETVKITPNGSGGLESRGGVGQYSYEMNWLPVGDNLFQFTGEKKLAWNFLNFDSDNYLAFGENDEGEIAYIYAGQTSYEKMNWYEDAALHILMWVVTLGLFISFIYQQIILWFWRWYTIPPYEERGKLEPSRWHYTMRILAGAASLFGAIVIVALVVLLLMDVTWLKTYTAEQATSFLRSVMSLPMIFLVFVPFLVAGCVWVWVKKYWTIRDRLYYTAVTAAALLATWQFTIWNVLFFRF